MAGIISCVQALQAAGCRLQLSESSGQWYGHGVGGPARVVVTATSAADLVASVRVATEHEVPYRVIGAGSSVLVSDAGYEGLLIRNCADALTLDRQRSVATVESGVRMRTLIMQAAAAELGGLVHRYQLDMGTVGGALVRGDEHPSPSILDLVRTVTVYAPASKRRPEGAVLTMPGSWLRVHEQPRLIPAAHPLPTVLSMQVQLTALRPDELQRRLQPHVQRVRHEQPAENTACIGPVFHVQESVDLRDMLHGARVLGLKRDGVHLSSQYPNYLMISPGTTTRQVTVFIQEVVARVHDTYGVTLEPIVQVIGNYPFGVVSSSTHAAL